MPIRILLYSWLVFSGLLGTVMTLSWMFSGHMDLHHNANLYLYWPLDLLLLFAFFRRKHKFIKESITKKLSLHYINLHICSVVFYISFGLFGFIEQNLTFMLMYHLPVAIIVLFESKRYVIKSYLGN